MLEGLQELIGVMRPSASNVAIYNSHEVADRLNLRSWRCDPVRFANNCLANDFWSDRCATVPHGGVFANQGKWMVAPKGSQA